MFEKRGDPEEEARAKSRRAIVAMERAFEQAMVDLVSPTLVESLANGLPDPDDAHVIAAAVSCQASTIVTENIKHFPVGVPERFSIGVLSTDRFLADTIDLDHAAAGNAISRMRARLRRPELTRDELLLRFEKNGFIGLPVSSWFPCTVFTGHECTKHAPNPFDAGLVNATHSYRPIFRRLP